MLALLVLSRLPRAVRAALVLLAVSAAAALAGHYLRAARADTRLAAAAARDRAAVAAHAARARATTARVDTVRDTVRVAVDRWRTVTRAYRDTVAVHDTVRLYTRERAAEVVDAGDAAVRACTQLEGACRSALAARDTLERAQGALLATQRAQLLRAEARAGRRWGVGLTAGPALHVVGGRVMVAPAVAVGVSWRVW